MKRHCRFISILLISTLLFSGCNRSPSNKGTLSGNDKVSKLRYAMNSPFGRYPECITYTLGKMTGNNNSNMPQGDTYENNAYTRYLKKMLNVQNKNSFEAINVEYGNFVSMAIAKKRLPDIMLVDSREELDNLVRQDLIEDLTSVYEKCASDTIKDIYNSYDDLLQSVTYDGKLMALPETNIEDGPNLLWLRKDWIDRLNMEEPVTFADAEKIIKAFVDKDPGDNGRGGTVGLLCDTGITSEYGSTGQYMMDIVFSEYQAYPKQWIRNKEGRIVYGSIQPEVKQALKKMRQLYKDGILDRNFLLRTTVNLKDLIVEGKCGSFFGPWWSPNNPLVDAVRADKSAEWKPYLLKNTVYNSTRYLAQNPSDEFVVVRKGYKHPEIAVKVLSVLFDYARYQDKVTTELENYYRLNVDPTARPFVINVDYSDALTRCYRNIQDVLSEKRQIQNLAVLEKSYYNSCQAYQAKKNAKPEDWAAYTSRITACEVIEKGRLQKVKAQYFGKTPTMITNWWKLQDMERKAFLEIILGTKSLDSFDTFVDNWHKERGDCITEEVEKACSRN